MPAVGRTRRETRTAKSTTLSHECCMPRAMWSVRHPSQEILFRQIDGTLPQKRSTQCRFLESRIFLASATICDLWGTTTARDPKRRDTEPPPVEPGPTFLPVLDSR